MPAAWVPRPGSLPGWERRHGSPGAAVPGAAPPAAGSWPRAPAPSWPSVRAAGRQWRNSAWRRCCRPWAAAAAEPPGRRRPCARPRWYPAAAYAWRSARIASWSRRPAKAHASPRVPGVAVGISAPAGPRRACVSLVRCWLSAAVTRRLAVGARRVPRSLAVLAGALAILPPLLLGRGTLFLAPRPRLLPLLLAGRPALLALLLVGHSGSPAGPPIPPAAAPAGRQAADCRSSRASSANPCQSSRASSRSRARSSR